ncbi:MAG: riboflavin synthase [Clostridia bacterium]|nr:riboflavin synthase [Clostridia bacterium]
MFTGIVEELGTIKSINKTGKSARLTIEGQVVLGDVKLGDSIAVNGVCLTVTEFDTKTFAVDVMAETLAKSNIGLLKPGSRVNLERALRLSDRLGGHLVSGHIDGIGAITGQERVEIAVVTEIKAPPQVMKYIVPKGSVAIDGISLTVVDHTEDTFRVSLIPHTAKLTSLGFKKIGDVVNLEGDVIGKYVERLISFRNPQQNVSGNKPTGSLSLDFLSRNGFA